MRYGNLDKGKEYPFPEKWVNDGDVIVKQERLIDVYGNGQLQAIPHQSLIQVYPKKIYDQMSIPQGPKKTTGFEDLGLKVTPLHNTSEPDEDLALATFPPAAETVKTSEMELIEKAVEAVKDGTGQTEAEEFKEESDKKAEQLGNIVAEPEKEADKQAKGKASK